MGKVIRLQAVRSLADDLEAAISAFIECSRSKNLSQETITFYRNRLRSFARFANLPPSQVTAGTVREFMTESGGRYSAQTVNHNLQVVKAFFSWLEAEGYIEENPAARVKKQRLREPIIKTFIPEQIDAMLRTCGRDFYGVRDRVVILALLDTGLRASELCGLTLQDTCLTAQTFNVLGKGSKERQVPFGQGVRQSLALYMLKREGVKSESLFVNHFGQPLDRYRLRELLIRRGQEAGISGVRCSPHTFRHTAAVAYLRAGGDVFTLQRLLGHSTLAMTNRYCESLKAEDVQAKHRLCSPVDTMKGLKAIQAGKRLI